LVTHNLLSAFEKRAVEVRILLTVMIERVLDQRHRKGDQAKKRLLNVESRVGKR